MNFFKKYKENVKVIEESPKVSIYSAREYHDHKQYLYEEEVKAENARCKAIWENYNTLKGKETIIRAANAAIEHKIENPKEIGWPEFYLSDINFDFNRSGWKEGLSDDDFAKPFEDLLNAGWDVHLLGTSKYWEGKGLKVQIRDVEYITQNEMDEYKKTLKRNKNGALLGRLKWGR